MQQPLPLSRVSFVHAIWVIALLTTTMTMAPDCGAVTLSRSGTGFTLKLSHQETVKIDLAKGALATLPPDVSKSITGAVGFIKTVDAVGDGKGVEIAGAINSIKFFVFPLAEGVVGHEIASPDDIANISEIVDSVNDWIRFGQDMGHVFGKKRGSVQCDEDAIGDDERLVMITTSDGKVAFHSRTGYLTATNYGKVLADRGTLGRDEQFDLVRNGDGTISLRTWMGTWVTADRAKKDTAVSDDRHVLGPWEKFKLVFAGNGIVALRESQNHYLSVPP